ncbi:MAG: gliding motility-associated ABC transporter substrate-binding protein GldG [Salibacteraceae bacterium]
MTKKRNQKGLDIAVLLITVAVVFLVNYIGSFWFGRLDLTSEKRYSLSEATRSQVTELEDVVFVKVYLEGDLPAALKRLQQSVKEILDEYRAYSNGNFEYEFVNPAISENEEENKQVFDQLLEKGLLYTNLEFQEGDISSKKIIFPGAIFSYREQEIPLQILPPQNTNDPLIEINRAINQLEYNISSTIKKLTREKRQTISFLQGHGELTGIEVADISRVLGDFYNLRADTIEGRLDALENLDGLIIAGPDSSFSDKDKFILDQFVMNGGRIMWLVDPVAISMDSLRDKRYTMSLPKQVRVEDMLFRYGVRLNTNLLMDMQCLTIPVDVSPVPEQPNYKPKPWFYYPLLTPAANHPIVTSIGPVKSEFVSSIDTLKTSVDVRKTVLLTTSKYTKVINSPSRVSLNILRNRPDERQFAGPARAAAVLLEGEFESAFAKLLPRNVQH